MRLSCHVSVVTHRLSSVCISDFHAFAVILATLMSSPEKILVVQPSWVGDAVMATPALRAVREHYPTSHISYLLRRYVKPLYSGMPWANQLITYRTGKTRT